MEIKESDIRRMKERLGVIRDPRREGGNLRHNLVDILVIALCSLTIRGEGFDEMEELGREREAWFRRFLELPNGIPDEDTFRRLFERIRPVELLGALQGWLGEGGPSGGREVNIDGKTVRGSGNGSHEAVHLVSAWVGEQNLTLGQLATEEKSNEITVIPQVLDLIDISDRCNEVSDRYSEEDTGAKGGLCPFGEGKPADFV